MTDEQWCDAVDELLTHNGFAESTEDEVRLHRIPGRVPLSAAKLIVLGRKHGAKATELKIPAGFTDMSARGGRNL